MKIYYIVFLDKKNKEYPFVYDGQIHIFSSQEKALNFVEYLKNHNILENPKKYTGYKIKQAYREEFDEEEYDDDMHSESTIVPFGELDMGTTFPNAISDFKNWDQKDYDRKKAYDDCGECLIKIDMQMASSEGSNFQFKGA